MEEYPQIGRGFPVFAFSKPEMEKIWDTVTRILNALGPPEKSVTEWKKVCRYDVQI